MPTIAIIYASTSGNTEYVIQVLAEHLRRCQVSHLRRCSGGQAGVRCQVDVVRAESAKSEDFHGSDLLILASGTWNKDGLEGHLNPHMGAFFGRVDNVDLRGRQVALIALGGSRYRYTCRAGERLRRFVLDHGGAIIEPPLLIIDEPYGQEEKIRSWSNRLQKALLAPPGSARLSDESEPHRSALAQPGSAETQ